MAPAPEQTTVGRYRQISGAGFNFVIGGNRVTDDVTNPIALQAAASNGLRFVLTARQLQQTIRNDAGTMSAQGTAPSGVMRHLAEHHEPERASQVASAMVEETSPDSEQQVRTRTRQLLDLYAGYRHSPG